MTPELLAALGKVLRIRCRQLQKVGGLAATNLLMPRATDRGTRRHAVAARGLRADATCGRCPNECRDASATRRRRARRRRRCLARAGRCECLDSRRAARAGSLDTRRPECAGPPAAQIRWPRPRAQFVSRTNPSCGWRWLRVRASIHSNEVDGWQTSIGRDVPSRPGTATGRGFARRSRRVTSDAGRCTEPRMGGATRRSVSGGNHKRSGFFTQPGLVDLSDRPELGQFAPEDELRRHFVGR